MKRKLDDEVRKRLLYLFGRKQVKASMSKIPFDLSFDDIYWPEFCPVLGLELNYHRKGVMVDESPSFDRVDPSLGYTKDNTRIISNRANRIKNDGSAEEHRKIAAYIEGHNYL